MAIVQSIVKVLTLRCRESAVLLSEANDRRLSRTERWALHLHLLICHPCRAYRRQLDRLRRVARHAIDRLDAGEALPGLALSDESRRRLRRAVDEAGEA
jgi:hypothetical protein